MSKLERKVNKEEEREFDLRSKDFYRPSLKQIGNSIYEIKTHYMSNGDINLVPVECPSHLEGNKFSLLRHLEDDSFLFKKNIVTGSTIKQTAGVERFPSMVVLMDSLALAVDLTNTPKPSNVQCDVLLAICGQPVIVLTLVDGDKDSKTVKKYNTTVGTAVTSTLYKFMDESINIVCGVVSLQEMETEDTFKTSITSIAQRSAFFVTLSSFTTGPSNYEKIVTAFWAGVAETRSVISADGQEDTDYLRFLTKDQCIILMENINKREVEVQSQPGSGATTLMIEVARRLARLESTLLICRSLEGVNKRFRSADLTVTTVEDLEMIDLSKYTNIVDETGAFNGHFRGKFWQSITEESLQHNVKLLEKENAYREKLLHLFYSGDRQDKFRHLSVVFETLKLFDISFQGLLSAFHLPENLALEVLPIKHKPFVGGGRDQRLEADDYAHHVLDQLKLGIRGRKDLFPLLADMTKQVKSIIPNLQAKIDFLRQATSGKPAMNDEENQAVGHDIPSREHEKHGELTDGKHRSGSAQSPNTGTEVKTISEKSDGKDSIRSANPLDTKTEKVEGGNLVQTTVDNVTEVTDSENTSAWKKKLASLKMEVKRKKQELAKLREATDHGVEWEYNIGCLAEEMATLKIQEIVTDIIGEDEIPVAPESTTKHFTYHDNDWSTRSGELGQGLIYQLRKTEYGNMKRRDIWNILKNVIKDNHSRLTDLRTQSDRLEREYGSPIHMVGEIGTNYGGPVSCPPMTFNRERVNEELAVSGDGLELVNWRGRSLDHRTDQFKNYWGTSSHLHIPLPPSPSTLTAATYWETHTRLQGKKYVSGFTLLEMAVCGEGQVDTNVLVSGQSRSSWGLIVGYCGKHPGVCTKVWENGRKVGECQTDTMSFTPGTDVTLKYGIALDVGRGRLAFIDVNRGRVLHKFDVNFRESLFPMCGVWPRPDDFHATMRLISGREVAMTGEKQQLIAQALFCK